MIINDSLETINTLMSHHYDIKVICINGEYQTSITLQDIKKFICMGVVCIQKIEFFDTFCNIVNIEM